MHIKFDVIDGVFEFHIVTLDAYDLKQKKILKVTEQIKIKQSYWDDSVVELLESGEQCKQTTRWMN